MLGSPGIDIPESESDDPWEVFAFAGLALYAAQVLEAELVNIVVGLLAGGKTSQVFREDVEEWFTSRKAKTFGGLASEIRKVTSLPQSTEDLITRALLARNRLAHDFFGEHSENFLSLVGRREIVRDLRAMAALFRDADAAGEAISGPLWSKLGVTRESAAKELSVMQARARDRDAAVLGQIFNRA